MFEIIVLLAVGYAVYHFFIAKKDGAASRKGSWLTDKSDSKYAHEALDTGIAIYPDRRELHLKGIFGRQRADQVYSFDDIRTWRINNTTPGRVYGGGSALRQNAANAQMRIEAERESGLFIEVRDVDHPEWHIRFKRKDRDHSLNRWMEILRQTINEGDRKELAE